MNRRNLFLSSGAALVALPHFRGQPPRRNSWIPTDATLDELSRWMDWASVPGLAMAVVEDGALAWSRGFGLADAGTKAPVTSESIFPAASLSKPMFGYVVLLLSVERRLDLDRPLVEYHRPSGLDPSAERVTARHVLSHSSGLPNWRGRAATAISSEFMPGTRFRYSGEGFYWLGQAVEAIAGRGIDAVIRERLLGPAGLPRSSFVWSKALDRDTVTGHDSRGGAVQGFAKRISTRLLAVADSIGEPMTNWTSETAFRALARADSTLPAQPNFALPNVAASLLCPVDEYARFLTYMMERRSRASWELPEELRREMLTPRTPVKGPLSWGLGWGLERRDDGQFGWHWGDNGIYRAFTLIDPSRRRGLVVFANAEGGPKVYQRLIRSAIGSDLAAFLWV